MKEMPRKPVNVNKEMDVKTEDQLRCYGNSPRERE